MGLDIEGADIEEFVEELMMGKFADVQSEQEASVQEHPTEEEKDRDEVSCDVIKSNINKM